MYSLKEIYQQAKSLRTAAKLSEGHTESAIWYGVKITLDHKDDVVKIYNVSNRGDYYEELSPLEYETFIFEGWKAGCYEMSINNYKAKVEKIELMLYPEGDRSPQVNRMIDTYLSNLEVLKETINRIQCQKNQLTQS